MTFNLKAIPEQHGRVAIVTGANSGIGYETCLVMAAKDIKVVMACRDLQKAELAKRNIVSQVPDSDIEIL
jgi:NAD(P)-dependent dehydrogenase (short-subunit alcohol dehydrogenase family)